MLAPMTTVQKINTAVFPVAGLGTRFLPATKAAPKEMLPVVDKPLIQYAVEEAYAAGVRHMVFVTGRSKRAIEDHFDTAYELENELSTAHKDDLLALVRSVQPADMVCSYVRQARSLGLGHAVLCAERLVGNEPFAVLLPDVLVKNKPSGLKQMIDAANAAGADKANIIAVEEVPMDVVQASLDAEPAGFRAFAAAFSRTARELEAAAQARDLATTSEIVGRMDAECAGCHTAYWYPEN